MNHEHGRVGYTTEVMDPFVFVPVGGPDHRPGPLDTKVVIDVIHDGTSIPRAFLEGSNGRSLPESAFYGAYVTERDWGASIVAARLAERLGLSGFYKVTTARCLLDFGRFPGTTEPNAPHLRRFAINQPFAGWLGFDQKRRLLDEHYDAISAGMDRAIQGRVLKLAVHTYDRYNKNGTERPPVSLVSRALGLQENHELPFGVFDPLFPDLLSEFTVDRILRDRISLTLEKAGVPVAHNYPYLLPEGSPEVRHQVWSFFDWLQQRFESAHPETAAEPGFDLAWLTLKDTNLRSAAAAAFRSYLHMYRLPPADYEEHFVRAERAYRRIERFMEEGDLTRVYRHDPDRAWSFGMEVRKDLVWRFDETGHPEGPATPDRAWYVADQVANAILLYFNEDRPAAERVRALGRAFEREEPWYAPGVPPGEGE